MAESPGQKWWSEDTIAVVTGGNRGIGSEIARQLATQGVSVVLADMVSDEELKKTATELEVELRSKSSSARVYSHKLDIRSDESVKQFAKWLKETFGHISILVNNAGIGQPTGNAEIALDTVETNYWGTKRVTKALMPLLSCPDGARIVFMTSRLGLYSRLKDGYAKEKLREVEKMTEDDMDDLARRYVEDVKAGRLEQEGWIGMSEHYPSYGESKMLVNAYYLLLAKSLLSDGNPGSILVGAANPGPTRTALMDDEIVKKLGFYARSIPEGADTAVWMALLPRDGYPYGKFFLDRQEFSYHLHVPRL